MKIRCQEFDVMRVLESYFLIRLGGDTSKTTSGPASCIYFLTFAHSIRYVNNEYKYDHQAGGDLQTHSLFNNNPVDQKGRPIAGTGMYRTLRKPPAEALPVARKSNRLLIQPQEEQWQEVEVLALLAGSGQPPSTVGQY